jgi:hypothetical protein
MQLNLYVFGILGLSLLFTYKYYYVMKKNVDEPNLNYTVEILDNYIITTKSRIYKYNARSSMFLDLEEKYRESLFGNYKKKEHVDKTLIEYLSHQPILQKHVIIITEGWIADITIDKNINNNYLIFNIYNDSLEESIIYNKQF